MKKINKFIPFLVIALVIVNVVLFKDSLVNLFQGRTTISTYTLIIPKDTVISPLYRGAEYEYYKDLLFTKEKKELFHVVEEELSPNYGLDNPPQNALYKKREQIVLNGNTFNKTIYDTLDLSKRKPTDKQSFGYGILAKDRYVFFYTDTMTDKEMEEILKSFKVKK
jgi:hypothetical protein